MKTEAKMDKSGAAAPRRWTSDDLARTARDVAGARRRTHPVRSAATVVIALILSAGVWACAVNPNFGGGTVWAYLFDRSVLTGIEMTLSLTVVSMVLGTVLGLACAMLKMSGIGFFARLADLYLWFFRSTPLLVQLLFWYNLAALFPNLGIPGVWLVPTNDVITPLTAAVVGLSLNEGAYMGEIIRAGLQSVDPAQRETAEAFGMSRSQILLRVMLAAGDARDHPAHGQSGDLDGEGDRHGLRDCHGRSALLGADDLQRELPDHSAPLGRRDLGTS